MCKISLKKVVVFLQVLLVTVIIVEGFAKRIPNDIFGNTTTPTKPPDIWLVSYNKVDSVFETQSGDKFKYQEEFQDDFISKNGSEYVVNGDTQAVLFGCHSVYPVGWKFPFGEKLDQTSQHNIVMEELRYSVFSPDSSSPQNTGFTTFFYILITRLNFLSVSLTCHSLENSPPVESSVYIYLNGKSGIENEGKTLSVYAPESTPKNGRSNLAALVLPCRPSSPETKLVLQRETFVQFPGNSSLQKMWKPMVLWDKQITFDPRIGFTLHRGLLGNRIFGMYKCVVMVSNDDDDKDTLDTDHFVLVNVSLTKTVTNGNDNNKISERNSTKKFNTEEKLTLNWTSSEVHGYDQVMCCSGVKNKPPIILKRYCYSPWQCEWMKDAILKDISSPNRNTLKHKRIKKPSKHFGQTLEDDPSDCTRTILWGTSVIARCKGESHDIVKHYVSLFQFTADGPVAMRSKKIVANQKKKTNKIAGVLLTKCRAY